MNESDCYAARGTGGQVILVVPSQEFVFVHRGDRDSGRDVGGRDIWSLAERILAAREAEPAEDPELRALQPEPLPDPAPARPDHRRVEVAESDLSGLAGEYDLSAIQARVFVHAGRLFARTSEGDEVELLPLSRDRFFLFSDAHLFEFERDERDQGRTLRMSGPEGTLAGRRLDGPH